MAEHTGLDGPPTAGIYPVSDSWILVVIVLPLIITSTLYNPNTLSCQLGGCHYPIRLTLSCKMEDTCTDNSSVRTHITLLSLSLSLSYSMPSLHSTQHTDWRAKALSRFKCLERSQLTFSAGEVRHTTPCCLGVVLAEAASLGYVGRGTTLWKKHLKGDEISVLLNAYHKR